MLQAGNNHKQSWMGLSLLCVRSSLTVLLYIDICLTYSGTPQCFNVHYLSGTQGNMLGIFRSDIKKSFLIEKTYSFLFSVVFYDLIGLCVSYFSRLNGPSLLGLSP